MDEWGDFDNKRQGDKRLNNTLAVFERSGGQTRQMCEYEMTPKNIE
jgi:hypothetical protein